MFLLQKLFVSIALAVSVSALLYLYYKPTVAEKIGEEVETEQLKVMSKLYPSWDQLLLGMILMVLTVLNIFVADSALDPSTANELANLSPFGFGFGIWTLLLGLITVYIFADPIDLILDKSSDKLYQYRLSKVKEGDD